jgi:hypothetical protein
MPSDKPLMPVKIFINRSDGRSYLNTYYVRPKEETPPNELNNNQLIEQYTIDYYADNADKLFNQDRVQSEEFHRLFGKWTSSYSKLVGTYQTINDTISRYRDPELKEKENVYNKNQMITEFTDNSVLSTDTVYEQTSEEQFKFNYISKYVTNLNKRQIDKNINGVYQPGILYITNVNDSFDMTDLGYFVLTHRPKFDKFVLLINDYTRPKLEIFIRDGFILQNENNNEWNKLKQQYEYHDDSFSKSENLKNYIELLTEAGLITTPLPMDFINQYIDNMKAKELIFNSEKNNFTYNILIAVMRKITPIADVQKGFLKIGE